jgi:hypothetical protein
MPEKKPWPLRLPVASDQGSPAASRKPIERSLSAVGAVRVERDESDELGLDWFSRWVLCGW